tara:strand:+ start:197 stop:385 length:189 start_codon:yes stop_codon:yes gene_type:complete
MGTSYIGEYPPLKCRSTTEMNKMVKIIINDEEFEFKERKIIVEKDICCCTETYVALCCREDE